MKANLNITLVFLLLSCVPVPYSSTQSGGKDLLFRDFNYEASIKSVLLYPDDNIGVPNLQPGTLSLLSQSSLVLEFDYLSETPESFYARIYHCTKDWKKSNLSDLEFLQVYNEFNLNDYAYSIDTKVDYIHYRFQLPKVKLPGNYVLIIYRNNPDDFILSRRFLVFNSRIQISLAGNLNTINPVLMSDHLIEFTLNYQSIPLDDPMGNISVDIRQNQQWENYIHDLKPNFVREDLKELEFRYFNLENAFKASNEFRFFDLRSVLNFGQNVENVINTGEGFTAILEKEKPRSVQAYGHLNDLNGKYTLENYDRRNPLTGSEYVNILFTLESEKIIGDVYITGELTNWGQTSPMAYNEELKAYTDNLLLKQGWYNYLFKVDSPTLPSYYLEGSHAQTENEYEILVYYRDIMKRADLLLGYKRFIINSR
jgi:hypothetical protein